jgi:two-component system sensor histidine kinase DesK
MLNWTRTNRIAIAGVIACLIFGGIEVLEFVANGVSGADRTKPIGVLAEYVAGWFTKPPSEVRAGTDWHELTYHIIVGWYAAMTVMFALLLWLRPRWKRRPRLDAVVLGLQILAAVLSLSALVYVLAAEIGVIKPLRQGIKWVAAQMALMVLAILYMVFVRGTMLGDDTIHLAIIFAGFGLLFQAVSFGMAQVAVRERHARLALAESNARLLATQSMLGDTVRTMERVRIARDLHDAVGHHLTALNLHLDLALRQSATAAPASLHTSRDLARSLLAEVRAVVSSERSEQHINLRSAIATMCAGIPAPRIAFDFEDGLEIASPLLANTLFFCVQEAVTNAARHADAETLTIDIRSRGPSVVLTVADDGRGGAGAAEGNGLRGMRERIEEQRGTLHCRNARPGFAIDVSLPLDRSGA